MSTYGVVIMDIVGSRHIEDRGKVQNKLINHIAEVNCKYKDILPAPVSITLGDEWQVILSKPSECYNIVHEFQQRLWIEDIEFYAGIGIGGLATPIYDDIGRMDGPCFHMAREAINIAKRQARINSKLIYSKRNRVFLLSPKESIMDNNEVIFKKLKIHSDSPGLEEVAVTAIKDNSITIDNLINILIENNEILKSRMTDKQKKVYMDYLRLGSYRKIIEGNEDGNDSIGGISQKLNSAEFFTIQRNHDMVSVLLNCFGS